MSELTFGFNKKIEAAVANLDSIEYFLACNDAGISPELPDLYEEGARFFLYEKLLKNPEYIKCKEFVKYSKTQKLNLENVFEQTDAKSKLLKDILGLKRLKITSKLSLPLSECKRERIGSIFRDYYNRAVKKISDLEKSYISY